MPIDEGLCDHQGRNSYGSGGMPPLPAQAAQWQTPVADDHACRLRGKINSRGAPKLSAQAIQWPTPAAQNWKGSSEASVTRADGKSRMDILQYRAEQGFTRPDPVTIPDGQRPLPHAPISRPLWAHDCLAWAGRLAADSESPGAAAAEPALRRMADGLAHRSRARHPRQRTSRVHSNPWRSPARTLWQQRMRGAHTPLPMASGPWIWRPSDGPEGPAQMNLFEGMLP